MIEYTDAWWADLLQRISEIALYEADWDGEGADPLDIRILDKAIELLIQHIAGTSYKPAVAPLVDGGLELEWRFGPRELAVELHGDMTETVYFRDSESGEKWEFDSLAEAPGHLGHLVYRLYNH